MAEDIKDKDLTREDILRYREDLVEHARRLFLDSDEKQVRDVYKGNARVKR